MFSFELKGSEIFYIATELSQLNKTEPFKIAKIQGVMGKFM